MAALSMGIIWYSVVSYEWSDVDLVRCDACFRRVRQLSHIPCKTDDIDDDIIVNCNRNS